MGNATTSAPAGFRWAALLVCAAGMLSSVPALGAVSVAVSGNTATATITLPGVAATELLLSFDSPQNLNAAALGISAQVVDPLDATLLARLPDAGLMSIPGAFPVSITVAPTTAGALSFRNAVQAEVHTSALTYTEYAPFRLYKAQPGGVFHDITGEIADGSVRARGTTGGFSEFLILVDLSPTRDHVEDRYTYLAARVQNPAIASSARSQLQSDLNASLLAYRANDLAGANSAIVAFHAHVAAASGTGIPNQWRALRDLDNIAGDLLGETAGLQYDLARLAAGH